MCSLFLARKHFKGALWPVLWHGAINIERTQRHLRIAVWRNGSGPSETTLSDNNCVVLELFTFGAGHGGRSGWTQHRFQWATFSHCRPSLGKEYRLCEVLALSFSPLLASVLLPPGPAISMYSEVYGGLFLAFSSTFYLLQPFQLSTITIVSLLAVWLLRFLFIFLDLNIICGTWPLKV